VSQPTPDAPDTQHYDSSPMATSKSPSPRATTPPKGRPTRSRTAVYDRKRVFGSTAQWIAVALLIVIAFIVLWMAVY
jgi:hypothetical protein